MPDSVNFGGIDDEQYSSPDGARILILPMSNARPIIEASQKLNLYDEETDSEPYKLGIHTLSEFDEREERDLYEHSKELLGTDKFLCTIGGDRSASAAVIRAHAEKLYDISALHITARADLETARDLAIPSVQVGVRSISADAAKVLAAGAPTKIYWAKDLLRKTMWIDDAIENLTENVYLSIGVSGLDPSLMASTNIPEPGGLGWYQLLELIKKLSERRRIVGMGLSEYSHIDNFEAPAYLCAKLVYKTLAYIFQSDTPQIVAAY